MKNIMPTILMLLLPALSFLHGATIPPMEVTVTNAKGKVAYKGTTGASGTFATGNLAPGNYVIVFDSKSKLAKGSKFAISATAGKYYVSSDSVDAEKFTDSGVAMRLTIAGNSKITGQIGPAGSLSKEKAAAAQPNTKSKYSGPAKIINGKRYIWITPYTGSVQGGHWAEEGSTEAMQAEGVSGVRPNEPPPHNSMKY